MVYSFELIKHANIRYRDSLVVLSRCELFAMLSSLGVTAEIREETLGGSRFLTVECRDLNESEIAFLSGHSSFCFMAENRNGLLRPLPVSFAGYLPEDLPEVLKYKGKTSAPFMRMMINTAVSLSSFSHMDTPLVFFDPVCGKGTGCFCAVTAGMDIMDCSEALMHIELTGSRLSVRRSGGLRVIDDTYNASPDAVKAALDVLSDASGNRRVAVLADMLELGGMSDEFHREIGKYAVEKGVDVLCTVGENAAHIAEGAEKARGDSNIEVLQFGSCEEFVSGADGIIRDGDVILVKGSHSMHMNDAVSHLLKLGSEIAQEER